MIICCWYRPIQLLISLCFFEIIAPITKLNKQNGINHDNETSDEPTSPHQLMKRQYNSACPLGMPPPLGGSVQYSSQFGSPSAFGSSAALGPYPSGTTATMICQGGIPTGTSMAVCMNGVWNPPMFSGCSLGNSLLPLGQIGLSSGIYPGMSSGMYPGMSTGMYPGMSSGMYPGIGGGMGIGQCLGMPPPLGGTVLYSTGYSSQLGGQYPSGTVATLQCQNGQLPSGGASSATCMNGMWQPAVLGLCSQGFNSGLMPMNSLLPTMGQQQQCLAGILPPLNGNVQYSGSMATTMLGPYPIGTMATLLCNPGFVPSGQTTSSCQYGGQFVPSVLGPCSPSGKRRR